ncbi:MAG TPA: pilus assembly protein N-terminal domain-containing protein [Pirellulales bacterium]|nr:pilus assembly protein N-terminal domain-containing protein [Pirellulales bacterium]
MASCLLLLLMPATLAAQSDKPRSTPSSDKPRSAAPSGNSRNIVHKLDGPSERMEMIVNTSRILTLDRDIPTAQVNNPDILELTPLDRAKIQIVAKKPGVTQVNLWDDKDEIHTVDVIVFADSQELQMLLQSQFPRAALKVVPLANSVIVEGYVDDPDLVTRIIEMAQDYHPKVINNIRVGGVQQVMLEIKIMEVSRTKLRNAGFDWGNLGTHGDYLAQGVGGLIGSAAASPNSLTGVTAPLGISSGLLPVGGTNGNFTFGVINNAQQGFFGILQLLQQQNIAKVLAEPKLTTVSGRPASFNMGGEFPILVPQSLGTISVQYRKYGTQVDFVPIVLGNGVIRLEVRPRISQIDPTLAITINGSTVPALKTREVDTGAELRAGETLAIAGLVQVISSTQRRGVLWLGELPWIGVPFRNMQSNVQEIELLILVTPHLVEAMAPGEVPPMGPGLATAMPSDSELVGKGYIEVPNCDPVGIMGPYPQGTPGQPGATGVDRPWKDQLPAGAVEIVPAPEGDAKTEQPAPSAGARRARKPVAAAETARLPDPGHSSRRRAAKPADRLEGPALSGKPMPAPVRSGIRKNSEGGGSALSRKPMPAPAKPTGLGPSSRRNPFNSNNQRGRIDTAARKSLPGFIGPTGNDLR